MPINRVGTTENVHGELTYSNSVSVANSYAFGAAGRFFSSSGLSVSGIYVELTTNNSDRQSILIHNTTSGILYVGSSNAGISNMLPVSGVSSITFAVTSGVSIYGITEGYIADIRIIESG